MHVPLRKFTHLKSREKKAIRESVLRGLKFREAAQSFHVSLGTVSRICRMSESEIDSAPKAGGKRASTTKVTLELVECLNETVSLHSDYTLVELCNELEKHGHPKLSVPTIHGHLSNMDITCKRICRVPKERNTETAIAERRE